MTTRVIVRVMSGRWSRHKWEVLMGTLIGDFGAVSFHERPCRTAVVLGM